MKNVFYKGKHVARLVNYNKDIEFLEHDETARQIKQDVKDRKAIRVTQCRSAFLDANFRIAFEGELSYELSYFDETAGKHAENSLADAEKKCSEILTLMRVAKMTLTEINTLSDSERQILSDAFNDKYDTDNKIAKK